MCALSISFILHNLVFSTILFFTSYLSLNGKDATQASGVTAIQRALMSISFLSLLLFCCSLLRFFLLYLALFIMLNLWSEWKKRVKASKKSHDDFLARTKFVSRTLILCTQRQRRSICVLSRYTCKSNEIVVCTRWRDAKLGRCINRMSSQWIKMC